MEESRSKVVPLPGQPSALSKAAKLSGELRPQALRRRIVLASFVLCVLIPAFLGTGYFLFVASDRYVAGAGFAVRSMDSGGGTDLFGTFTGIANAGTTTSDSYILLKYLKSRSMLEKLEKDFPLQEAYSNGDVDFLSRLDPETDIEHRVEYWSEMISTSFDNISGIVTLQTEAFRPDDARRVTELVLGYCKQLVNELSERARDDAVAFADGEVDRAETRLRTALEKIRMFRETEQSIDPARSAQVQIEIIGALEKQLLETRARISALEGSVDENSPSLRTLRKQAEAQERQIAAKQSEISKGAVDASGEGSALSGLLAAYETLEVERNFAQQAYASALSSLEKSRVEAGRQQRYLAVYETPAVPEYPIYPRRLLNILLLVVILTGLWGIGVLIGYSVRDHMS